MYSSCLFKTLQSDLSGDLSSTTSPYLLPLHQGTTRDTATASPMRTPRRSEKDR
jgi:hypothetical protein